MASSFPIFILMLQQIREGYRILIEELITHLIQITGFDAISMQPNSGDSREYAGLMVIRKFHLNNGGIDRIFV